MRRRFVVAAAWFDTAVAVAAQQGTAVPRLRAAEWCVARGLRVEDGIGAQAEDWRAWALAAAGLDHCLLLRLPAGPALHALAAAGVATESTPESNPGPIPAAIPGSTTAPWHWCCATPVHLQTALDHLQLAPPAALALSGDDAGELCATLASRLAQDGYALYAAAADEWLLGSRDAFGFSAVPPERAIGRNLREFMPTGPGAGRMLAVQTELQMLLHEHPVNERRVARGLAPVNSLWLHGAGIAGELPRRELPALWSTDRWLQGLWRSVDAAAVIGVGPASTVPAAADAVLTADWQPGGSIEPVEALLRFDAEWLQPLLRRLWRGQLDELSLLLGARSLRITRASRLRVWRAPRAFEVARA